MEGHLSARAWILYLIELDQEPVEVNEGGGDVLPGPGVSEDPGHAGACPGFCSHPADM